MFFGLARSVRGLSSLSSLSSSFSSLSLRSSSSYSPLSRFSPSLILNASRGFSSFPLSRSSLPSLPFSLPPPPSPSFSPLSLQVRSVYTEKLKSFKATSPGIRFRRIVDRSHLWKGKPHLPLTVGLRKTGGRNSHGHITVRGKGGGHKRRYRMIDFKRDKEGDHVVVRLEYDPNRTAWIALIQNQKTNEFSYILCPKNLEPGDIVSNGDSVEVKIGNCCPLKNIPAGTIVHNIELYPGKGGILARSAGNYAQLLKTGPTGYAYLRMPSTEVRMIPVECRATIGSVSNSLHQNIVLGKAGVSRWLGRRPKVRGVAMNPVDHPHGGGEGKGAPGRPSVSPTGVLAKCGKKTRLIHKFSNVFVVEQRKRGKNGRKAGR